MRKSGSLGILGVNTLSWFGESVSVYVDADPFWLEFAKVKDKYRENFLLKNLSRFAVALQADVKNGLKLAMFLTALRAYVDKTVPGLLTWETLKHKGRGYVKVSTSTQKLGLSREQDLALYYLVSPKSFTVTFNHPLLKRAIDRELARKKPVVAKKPAKSAAKPWLGKSLALRINQPVIEFFAATYGDEYQQMMQVRAWANLPVLNEWKRRFPKRNPMELHQRYWNVELRCPGGGKYAWNAKHHTFESTIYGHPGAPKPGPKQPAALRSIQSANFGVTFEHKGLRARMEIDRAKRSP